MIRASFEKDRKTGLFTGFSVTGHAGYREEGADLVCAAVSSAVYMAVNTITEVLFLPASGQEKNGDLRCRVTKENAAGCRVCMEGLCLHLQGLSEQYSQYLQVSILEV